MLPGATPYRKKLRGWLSYAFASEVFVIVSLTLFLPICLEQFARDNGYLLPGRTERCTPLVKLSTRQEALSAPNARCVVKIGWAWIDSASFSLYVYSVSVALQAITVISMGGIADHPSHRKQLLLFFAFLGATSATLFLILPSTSSLWPLAAPLAICANVAFGASVVAMNAYLPTLAKESPEVQQIIQNINEIRDTTQAASTDEGEINEHSNDISDQPSSPLIQRVSSSQLDDLKAEYDTELSRVTSRISSLGIALGYGAGILLLIVALIPVTKLHGSTFALRLAIGLSGIWWAIFTLPAALWLPGVKSASTTWSEVDAGAPLNMPISGSWNIKREIIGAWKRLGNMLRLTEIKKLKNTFKYLAAWFLLSDGFTTITSTAILFGKTTLNMQASALILVGVLTPTSGILGSLAWPVLQRRYGWTNLKVIVILVVMASAIPAYGCLGFLPIFQDDGAKFGGLTTQNEMFGLAVYFGSVYGAFQGYARAFYADLVPPGEEARWYGLFSITDKSSSFIGPLIVGLIADTTGNIRYAFFFLVVMIWAAVPILMNVDIDTGRNDARNYRYSAQ